MVELHSSSQKKRYLNSRISLGYLFWILYYIAIVLVPFAIGWATHHFWTKQDVYHDQQRASFTNQYVFTVEGDQTFFTHSTNNNYNNMFPANQVRVPSFSTSAVDINGDKIPDEYFFTFQVPVTAAESVRRVTVWLEFQCALDQEVRLSTTTVLPLIIDAPKASTGIGGSISKVADLQLFQRHPLSGTTRYAPASNYISSVYTLDSLKNFYMQLHARNETVSLAHEYPVMWVPKAGEIELTIKLKVPQQNIYYTPTVSYTLKMGWIQYLAILIPFIVLMRYVKAFVYEYQIVGTHVAVDTKPPEKAHMF